MMSMRINFTFQKFSFSHLSFIKNNGNDKIRDEEPPDYIWRREYCISISIFEICVVFCSSLKGMRLRFLPLSLSQPYSRCTRLLLLDVLSD